MTINVIYSFIECTILSRSAKTVSPEEKKKMYSVASEVMELLLWLAGLVI